jgi:hemerythrin-like domain-containing protein
MAEGLGPLKRKECVMEPQVDIINKEIVPALIDHHKLLKRCIDVVTDEQESEGEKVRQLAEFLEIFEMHAKCEEQTLYLELRAHEALRVRATEGKLEHDIADGLAHELRDSHYQQAWTEDIEAKAKVLAELVRHHILEEEQDLFPRVERQLDRNVREDLGRRYLEACNRFLEQGTQETIAEPPQPMAI